MRQQGRRRAVARTVGVALVVAAAVLVGSCDGSSTPTEVTVVEAGGLFGADPTTVSSGGPGHVEGCVPDRQFPMLDDAGVLHWFVPDESACTTRIAHQRRTMTVELVLPPEMRPGRNLTLDITNTGWRCPMPGPTWDPVCLTEEWTFRVKPNGRYSGTCHIHDF